MPAHPPQTRIAYRIRQGLAHLRPRDMREVDAALAALLPPAQLALVRRLAGADRAHLLKTGRQLKLSGDAELVAAGLLHDVGKVDGYARVRLPQRVLTVLLGASAPSLLHRLAQPSRRRWRHGLYLTVAHPVVGAELARAAGAAPRVCRLIAAHHDADPSDPAVRLLQQADEEAGPGG